MVHQSAVAILVLVFITAAGIWRESAATVGLDAFLAEQYRSDPSASKDSFESLPSHLRSSARPDLHSLLASLVVTPSLHVRLVSSSPSAASLLRSYISSAAGTGTDTFHVISPPDHSLSVSHSLHVDVSLASPSLASRLSRAISDQISASVSSLRSSSLAALPYSLVDRIVADDFQKEIPLHGGDVYLYFLDLGPHSKPYAYSDSASDSDSPAFTRCLGTAWTGEKHRYAWVDLRAGPVEYGPSLSGDVYTSPSAEKAKSEKALMAEVAGVVSSAYRALMVPSLRTMAVSFDDKLVVQLIHVHGEEEEEDRSGLDWNLVEKALTEEKLVLGTQSLVFEKHRVRYGDCPVCAYAISRATSSFTSRFLFDNYTMIVNEYLDSKRLHRVLSESEPLISSSESESESSRVVPVYVFDLEMHSGLLLDRAQQSVGFKDMVIAVRTRNTQAVTDYTCNNRHVFHRTRSLERPLVASLLQTLWGVGPTQLTRSNATVVDYAWSAGPTPFGPFSDSLALSFALRDAARRNPVLAAMHRLAASSAEAARAAAEGSSAVAAAEFAERWNLMKGKVERAVSAASRCDFERAMHYLRSCDHDLYAMHSLLYVRSQALEASLSCFRDPPFPWLSLSVTVLAVFALFYVFANRDRFFRNKSKQF